MTATDNTPLRISCLCDEDPRGRHSYSGGCPRNRCDALSWPGAWLRDGASRLYDLDPGRSHLVP
ncbi:MAG: hypothetical protein U5K36_08045 [Roseovarius sp.]|nr:hypothetical protein [Roseovarius sp.]